MEQIYLDSLLRYVNDENIRFLEAIGWSVSDSLVLTPEETDTLTYHGLEEIVIE
jgi:hypothetical protein